MLPISVILAGVLILIAAAGLALRVWQGGSKRSLPADLTGAMGSATAAETGAPGPELANRARPRLPGVWIPLLASMGLSAAVSVQPAVSWPWVLVVGAYLVAAWAFMVGCDTPERVEGALGAIFWGTTPWVVFGMALAIARVDWFDRWGPMVIQLGFPDHRADSIFGHPNLFAGYLLLAIGAGLALGPGRWRRYGPPLAAMVACLIMTEARSAWIGAGVMGMVLLARWWRRSGAFGQVRAIWLAVVAAGVAIPPLFPAVRARFLTLFQPHYESNQGHLLVWEGALRMIAVRPWLGWGPGTWATVYPHFRDPREFEHLTHAHSIYLGVACEQGIVTLVFLLLFFGAVASGGIRSGRTHPWTGRIAPALGAAIVGYFTMGLFDYQLSEGRNAVLLFACAGLILAARVQERRAARS